jgi:large subunit ribosomal protein L45
MAFAQITVGFKSHQRYAAYDGKGRLVAGDPDKYVPVEVSFFQSSYGQLVD